MSLGRLEVYRAPEREVMDGWAWDRQLTTLWKNWPQMLGLLLRPAHLTGQSRFLSKLGESCVFHFFFSFFFTLGPRLLSDSF